MSKKILIIGNSANAYALAKKISKKNEVIVAPGSATISEFATCVDLREDAVGELLEFVMENGIDITIPLSVKSLKTDIVEIFNSNSQQIFAPSLPAASLIFDKALMKKILYKLRIPTPKFGIFEKQNMAFDYIKNQKTPFVIKTNDTSSAVVLSSTKTAKSVLDACYSEKNQKVLIEDYLWGTSFSFYAISDGYKALPLGSSLTYKYSLDGEGGQLTSGMGACIPNYKLSIDNEYFLMDNVIYPLLEYLDQGNNPYLGFIGVNGILLDDGSIQVLGLQPFMLDCDCQGVLELLDENLVELMESCLLGSFSDEKEYIKQKNLAATSLVMQCKNKEVSENAIIGAEESDDMMISYYSNVHKNKYLELEANNGNVLVLTTIARTTSSAKEKLYNYAEFINFNGIYYRKDVCKISREHV